MVKRDRQIEVDAERLCHDHEYLDSLTRALLDVCSQEADHVELRRTAMRVFPALARPRQAERLAAIVGHAATLRASQSALDDRDVTDARLEMTATDPLDFAPTYGEVDEETRTLLVEFCARELAAGHDGPAALERLLRLHGWPYSERTFYVGPWKAARLRQRRLVEAI